MIEHRVEPITVSRDELYRQVWETPMQRLAREYGISGNGLAKICDRLNVPYPPRGHWAKREAAKPVRQAKLPPAGEGTVSEVRIRPTAPRKAAPAMSAEMQQRLSAALQETSGIIVVKKLTNPHPIIARWIEEKRRTLSSSYTDKPSRSETQLESRRHRILHTLSGELERRGFTLKADHSHAVWAEIDGLRLDFKLVEHIRRIRRPLTRQEAKQRSSYATHGWIQQHIPSGNLVFTIVTPLENGITQKWMDAGDKRLERDIGAIVATFVIAGPILRERRRHKQEQQRHWAEQEHLRQEKLDNQRRDENRWRRFLEFSRRWHDCEIARHFLARIESLLPAGEPTAGGYTQSDWVEWVRANLERLDPLSKGPSGLWLDLFEVSAWAYHDPRSA